MGKKPPVLHVRLQKRAELERLREWMHGRLAVRQIPKTVITHAMVLDLALDVAARILVDEHIDTEAGRVHRECVRVVNADLMAEILEAGFVRCVQDIVSALSDEKLTVLISPDRDTVQVLRPSASSGLEVIAEGDLPLTGAAKIELT